MYDNLIMCKSITYAQRASRALQYAGIGNQIIRIPAGLVRSGCGYGVRVRANQLDAALLAMKMEKMQPIAVFEHNRNGYHEVAYDLS